jgi:hypothetical protein
MLLRVCSRPLLADLVAEVRCKLFLPRSLGIEPNFENYTGDDLIEPPGCGRGGSAGGRGGLGYGGGFGSVLICGFGSVLI